MIKHERDLQSRCIGYLKEKGIYYVNIHGGGWGAKGSPDLLVCLNGRFVAFELKVVKNDLQDDQIIHKRRIERSGGLHFSPYTFEEFLEILEELSDGIYSPKRKDTHA